MLWETQQTYKIKICMIFLLILIGVPVVSASCSEGQIDINSAEAEELIEIVYIGEVRAKELITLRPFDSVDELIEIKGIGEVYLSKIKEQGLACVDEEEEEEQEEDEEEEITIEPEPEEDIKEEDDMPSQEIEELPEEIETTEKKEIILPPINLNTGDLKDKNNKNQNLAIYGLILFCILLGFLFIERRRRLNKNEFR